LFGNKKGGKQPKEGTTKSWKKSKMKERKNRIKIVERKGKHTSVLSQSSRKLK
jgi:hypothetical protein